MIKNIIKTTAAILSITVVLVSFSGYSAGPIQAKMTTTATRAAATRAKPGNVLNRAASQGNTDAQNVLTQARTVVDVEVVENEVSKIDIDRTKVDKQNDAQQKQDEIDYKKGEISYEKYQKK